MAFEDEILEFAKEIPAKLEYIDTEETTKIALITPFLRMMGYDTTNPAEVRAEYTADVGSKKGEKVDIENVSELYNYKDRILKVVNDYLGM